MDENIDFTLHFKKGTTTQPVYTVQCIIIYFSCYEYVYVLLVCLFVQVKCADVNVFYGELKLDDIVLAINIMQNGHLF